MLVNCFISFNCGCGKKKTLRLKSKFEIERSRSCRCLTGCQNRVDSFVLKSVLGRILKISILGAMSADMRMTWLESFNTRCYWSSGSRDLGSIPCCVMPKTLKMVLDTFLLNTQQYKVCIKGKVEQSSERSCAIPYIPV